MGVACTIVFDPGGQTKRHTGCKSVNVGSTVVVVLEGSRPSKGVAAANIAMQARVRGEDGAHVAWSTKTVSLVFYQVGGPVRALKDTL